LSNSFSIEIKLSIATLVCSFVFGAGPEVVTYTSANPFAFYHIITDLENQPSQPMQGILHIPDGEGPFPLVVGAAGSLGWGNHHFEYMEMYRSMGIATFELQSFKSRNVTSTVGEQISVTTAMMVLDAYRALETLRKDPRIDGDRVAITGWSLGGGVTLFSAWKPLKNAISEDASFAAHLAFYPPCFVQPQEPVFTDAPIHILIGELDNWTPATACEELVPMMKAEGAKVDITVYPGVHHSFDRATPPEINESGYSFTDCRFKMNSRGKVLMNFLNIPMTTPFRQKLALSLCAGRGPTYGGNPDTRAAAFDFARRFMRDQLLPAGE